jgi:outer membrane protein OmpA-like peptidoglycan-associated protein
MDSRFEKTISVLDAKEEGISATNVGYGINSPAEEYTPVLSADGLHLYFTGSERPDCIGGEDIFFSEFGDGIWQRAINLGSTINTGQNEAINAISADENTIVLFGNYRGSYGKGDNFFAEKTAQGWTEIQHFPRPINSEYYDSDAFVTSDGKAVLFVSDRPGGVVARAEDGVRLSPYHGSYWGNTDIYVCFSTDTGWSKAINLGPTINTPYTERTPFLHPDGKTLYFSSDGHYGLGRMDVFRAVRLREDSWTEWSEPVNLGKEINTASDDWGYTVATSGEVAFFSAKDRIGGCGGEDIYSVALPIEARPQKVATIRGRVTDQKGKPLNAEIKWEDLTARKNIGQLKSNPRDGTYFITLIMGKNYGYYAEKPGYYPISKNVDLRTETKLLSFTEDIVLVSIEAMKKEGLSVRINNIFFDFDKSELRSESYPELDRLAKIVKEDPGLRVEISGHTDSIGTHIYNLELSHRRAESVVNYLILVGCRSENLISIGYAEAEPATSNETEEGRAQNRRVEFRILR